MLLKILHKARACVDTYAPGPQYCTGPFACCTYQTRRAACLEAPRTVRTGYAAQDPAQGIAPRSKQAGSAFGQRALWWRPLALWRPLLAPDHAPGRPKLRPISRLDRVPASGVPPVPRTAYRAPWHLTGGGQLEARRGQDPRGGAQGAGGAQPLGRADDAALPAELRAQPGPAHRCRRMVKVSPWLLRLRRARLAAVGRPALPRGAQPRPRVAAVGRRSMVKVQSGQCPCSAPVPGGSGRLGTPREAVGRRPTGRPATASGARASRLQSR